MRVIRREAEARGLDSAKIGAMACSAGSHLSLLLALSSRSPDPYRPVDALDATPQPPLAWLVAMCPAYVLTDGLEGPNAGGGVGAALDPVFALDEASCPVCFFHGSADQYSPLGSKLLAEKLRGKGVHAELYIDEGRGHGPIGPEPFRNLALPFLRRTGVLK